MTASHARDVRVNDVARPLGVAPQQVTAWRRVARKGRLALSADEAAPFAALVMEEPSSLDRVEHH
jgi:transposase